MITKHGRQRIRERVGVNSKSCSRLAELAKTRGLEHKYSYGRLKKWIDGVSIPYREARDSRCYIIFNDFLFVFTRDKSCLITVLKIPSNLHRSAEQQINKRRMSDRL